MKIKMRTSTYSALFVCLLAFFLASASTLCVSASADSFTEVFHTDSFRGSFAWFQKVDWVGTLVQAVISIFSLVGAALIIIRIMTSMLFLSAKGLWEEVHDLKQSGESEMYDFGVINMAKSWAKGKSGTGLDAIFGAVLMLLPDVKRYSDFGEKSGQKFEEDTTISQYMLKIALPTVLAIFFLAMGFNGTLVKGLAVTVDAMGTLADHAVSVNYSGFVDDLVATKGGYKFTFAADGTEKGDFQQGLAKEIYGKAIHECRGLNEAQLNTLGLNIENAVKEIADTVPSLETIPENVKEGLTMEGGDQYWSYVQFDTEVNISEAATGAATTLAITDSGLLSDLGLIEAPGAQPKYIHVFIKTKGGNASGNFTAMSSES